MTKISGFPEDTGPTTDDFILGVDTGTSTTKKIKWLSVISMIFNYGYQILRQNDTTNITETNSRILSGWGVIPNGTGNTAINENVIFPSAFTSPPIVVAVCGGDNNVLGAYGTGGNTVEGRIAAKATAISTSGFTVWIHQEAGTSFGAGYTYYQWIAIGT